MSSYPEHDKLTEVKDETQAIGEFIDWCQDEKGIVLAKLDDQGHASAGGGLMDLLAEWAGIDLRKIEAEKRQMLAQIRHANGVEE
jgi:hypothetical protein